MKEIIATLATELGFTAASLQKVRQRGYVPYKHQLALLDLAEEKGVEITRHDLKWKKPKRPAPKAKRARAA